MNKYTVLIWTYFIAGSTNVLALELNETVHACAGNGSGIIVGTIVQMEDPDDDLYVLRTGISGGINQNTSNQPPFQQAMHQYWKAKYDPEVQERGTVVQASGSATGGQNVTYTICVFSACASGNAIDSGFCRGYKHGSMTYTSYLNRRVRRCDTYEAQPCTGPRCNQIP